MARKPEIKRRCNVLLGMLLSFTIGQCIVDSKLAVKNVPQKVWVVTKVTDTMYHTRARSNPNVLKDFSKGDVSLKPVACY